MGCILDTLAKRGEAVNLSAQAASPAAARVHIAKVGGYGESEHDTATPVDALGSASSDASAQDEGAGVDVMNLDATLFDQKVRELAQSAGHAYNFKTAREAGLVKSVDPELVAGIQHLQKNAGFLNRLVRKTNERLARAGKPPIGSARGSTSGEISDDNGLISDGADVAACDKSAVIAALAGQVAARLRLMGRAK